MSRKSSKPRDERKSAKAAGLTDAEKIAVRSSAVWMSWYLVAGAAAMRCPPDQVASLAGTATDWRTGTSATWTIPQWAGDYWARVSLARERAGLPLDLPNMGRLTGAIKAALAGRTRDELFNLVCMITSRWSDVAAAFSWMSSPPALDEATLQNPKVLDVAKRLMAGLPAVDNSHAATSHPRSPTGRVPTAEDIEFGKQLAERARNPRRMMVV